MKVCCRLQKVRSVPGLLSGIVGSSDVAEREARAGASEICFQS